MTATAHDRERLRVHADYLDRIGRQSLASALRAVVDEAEEADPLPPHIIRGAARLVYEVRRLIVDLRVIDSRSPAGDACLDLYQDLEDGYRDHRAAKAVLFDREDGA